MKTVPPSKKIFQISSHPRKSQMGMGSSMCEHFTMNAYNYNEAQNSGLRQGASGDFHTESLVSFNYELSMFVD